MTESAGCPSAEELFEADGAGPGLEPDSTGSKEVSLLESKPPESEGEESAGTSETALVISLIQKR